MERGRLYYLVIRFGRQCYWLPYNICSKCSPFARIRTCSKTYYTTRQLHCQWRSAMVHAVPSIQQTLLQFVNAVQLRLMHSLLDVISYLEIDRIKVDAVRRPEIWKNESGCWLFKKSQCCVPGSQVRCLVERWRNRLTRCASWATAAVTGACRGNSRRWSSLPDGQRWGPWG